MAPPPLPQLTNTQTMGQYGQSGFQQPNPYGNNILGQQYQPPGSQFNMDQFQAPSGMPSLPAGNESGGGWFDQEGMFGKDGWVSPALNTFSGLTSAWLGMKQYGLAKDSLKESKRQFNINHKNQVSLTNSQLRDRQSARVASSGNSGAYESVNKYMEQNGVS